MSTLSTLESIMKDLSEISEEDITPPNRRIRKGGVVVGKLDENGKKLFHLLQRKNASLLKEQGEFRDMIYGSHKDQSFLIAEESKTDHDVTGCPYCRQISLVRSISIEQDVLRSILRDVVLKCLSESARIAILRSSTSFCFEIDQNWNILFWKDTLSSYHDQARQFLMVSM